MANDQLVLITGGSGHLGFRTLVFALHSGYRIRAAVRSPSKAALIREAKSIQAHLDKLEFVVVPEILADGAYDEAVKGVDYILHVASPISFSVSFLVESGRGGGGVMWMEQAKCWCFRQLNVNGI